MISSVCKKTPKNKNETIDKIQHHFVIKTLNKPGIEGNYLNLTKAMYENPTANTMLSG